VKNYKIFTSSTHDHTHDRRSPLPTEPQRLTILRAIIVCILYLLDDIEPFDDGAEDDVFVVQPGGLDGGDEELTPVGVGAAVGHRHHSGSCVLQLEVLVLELGSIDRLACT